MFVTLLTRSATVDRWIKLIRTYKWRSCLWAAHSVRSSSGVALMLWLHWLELCKDRVSEPMDVLLKSVDKVCEVTWRQGLSVRQNHQPCGYTTVSWQQTSQQTSGIRPGFPPLSLVSAGQGDLASLKADADNICHSLPHSLACKKLRQKVLVCLKSRLPCV